MLATKVDKAVKAINDGVPSNRRGPKKSQYIEDHP